ncbi:MAG: AbrB/MazE/SpoVT family DNA-binding domain-containing protein [Gemmataceae bacterium]|nr:AbrB/MazE/SpoVT family DNA-binding domain-containing protein [Gemmataceae bacterium]
MKTRIIQIGNSKGIRLPKAVLEIVGFDKEIEVQVRKRSIVLKNPRHPRAGWAKALREMAERGDDALLDADASLSSWDEEEWEWR